MDEKPSARADLISAVIWIVFGGAIVYGAWTMDRLENLHINPYTAPGLVPGILGASIALMGLLLALRAWRAGALTPAGAPAPVGDERRAAMGRVALALTLCLIFGAGLVGHGPPFWAATILFVFAFIVAFQWHERTSTPARLRGAGIALAVAVGAAVFVTGIFQELFLVRLP
jgi:hypothetical protein